MTQKITVTVKTRCSEPYVEEVDTTHFKVGVKELPTDGKANAAVIEALANYLKLAKTRISIKIGGKYKEKIFEIK